MADPTKIQHPLLRRPGASQRKRLDAATRLSPARAPVDGRTLGDMLDFVHQYARQLVFHAAKTDDQGQPYVELSNWLDFFEHSLPFLINRFCKTDLGRLETDLQAAGEALERQPGEAQLRMLLDLCYFDLIDAVEQFQQRTRESGFEPLVRLLDHRARTDLLPPLRRFIELSNAAATYFCFEKLDFLRFSEPPWEIPFDEIFQTDESFTSAPGGRDGATAWFGAEVTKAAWRFLKAQRAIADELPGFLGDSIALLEKRHEPHLGLLFAFLRLFEHFQGDLNALTQKHLDFFYTDVLRLRRRQMEPDRAHLIFEPAKHLPNHLIKKGALFKDAKDDNNVDILFGLNDDIVIDKAKVVSLQTLYLDRSLGALEDGEGKTPRQYVRGLYAAPVANSADGKGEAFAEEASKNWATLGAKQSKFTPPGQQVPADHPFARLGFVLASQVLWLNEGHRAVSIRIKCDTESFADWYDGCFDQALGEFTDGKIYRITEESIKSLEVKKLTESAREKLHQEFSRDKELRFPRQLEVVASTPKKLPSAEASTESDLVSAGQASDEAKITQQIAGESILIDQTWESFLADFSSQEDQALLREWVTSEEGQRGNYVLRAFDPEFATMLQWLEVHKGQEFVVEDNEPLDVARAVCRSGNDFQVPARLFKELPEHFDNTELVSLLDISSYLDLSFSGEESWFAPNRVKVYLVRHPGSEGTSVTLRIEACLDPGEPKVAFYKEDKLKELFVSDCLFPMAKVELGPEVQLDCDSGEADEQCCLGKIQQQKFAVGFYHFLSQLKVQVTDIRVDVDGLKNLVVQNEESLQDVNSLIYPFGARPRLYSEFYVGSKELLCKAWQAFSLNVEWKDKPVNGFAQHYKNYTNHEIELEREENPKEPITDDLFEVDRAVLEDGEWLPLDKVPLFPDLTVSRYSYRFSLVDMPEGYEHTFKRFDDSKLGRLTVDSRDAFLSLRLRGASFQHAIYPFVLGRYLMELARILDESTVEYVKRKIGVAKELNLKIEEKILEVAEEIVQFKNNLEQAMQDLSSLIADIHQRAGDASVTSLASIKSKLDGFFASAKEAIEEIVGLLDVDPSPDPDDDSPLLPSPGDIANAIGKANAALGELLELLLYIDDRIPELKGHFDDWELEIDSIREKIDPEPLALGLAVLENMLLDAEEENDSGAELDRQRQVLDDISANVKDPGELPKDPYTPKIKSISIDYSARSEKVELIHLYPFTKTSKSTGWCNIEQEPLAANPTLLPSFTDQGTLFIGCEQLRPNANLSLLMQFAEATADTESESAEISWQYLSENRWKELRPGFELLSDGTEKLTRSGIVKIALPGDISNKGNTLMPPPEEGEPLFWLKLSAKRDVAGVAELLGVHAQAALATYEPKQGSDPDRVGKPLAPEQISKPLQPDFGIKSVEQLYKTFGGRVAEAEGATPARMGELLRHKNRSVDAFDIEHLVLDAFPELFKCKCIGHTMGLSARQYRRDLEVAPGFLMVAVVPDLKKLDPGDLLGPRAPRSILGKVEQFLKARMSTFARVRVMNPRYEPIHVKIAVRLKPGVDKDYHLAQLKTDLGRLLSPWYLGDSDKLSFGQEVSYSDVLGFVEGLDYVEQVTCMRLYDFRSTPDSQPCESGGLKKIVPLTARSILTSAPANIHTWLHDPQCCEERGKHGDGDGPLQLLADRPRGRNGNPCADPADHAVDPDSASTSRTPA